MKRALVFCAMLALGAGRSFAWWDIKDNPDRFISVGVRTGTDHFSGTTNNLLDPNLPTERVQGQRLSGNVYSYGFNLRVPMMKQVTFEMDYQKYDVNSELVREANTFQNHDDLKGEIVTVGARFYFAR